MQKFLQNFKGADGQPLPEAVVSAILAEHTRLVAEAVKPFEDYDSTKDQLKTATDGLKAFEGVDVADLKNQIAKLQGDLTAKEQEHADKLEAMRFDGTMKDAITAAKGLNVGAVLGALGPDKVAELRASKNQGAEITAALEALKKDSAYLFGAAETPPPYAWGTGSGSAPPGTSGTGIFNFGFTGVRAGAAKT